LPLSFTDDADEMAIDFRSGSGFISTGSFAVFLFLFLLHLPFSYPTITLKIKTINPTNKSMME